MGTISTRPPRGKARNADHDERTAPVARPKTAYNGRSGRRRRGKAGDLEALRRELWHAVRLVSDALDADDLDVGDLVRGANALAALANSYRGVTESADLVPRLEALEAATKGNR